MSMKCSFATLAVCGLFLAAFSAIGLAADPPDATLGLVPLPAKVVREKGAFTLNADTKIAVDMDSADVQNVARRFAERLNRNTGFHLDVSPPKSAEIRSSLHRRSIRSLAPRATS